MFKKRIKDVNPIVKKFIKELEKEIRVEKIILYGSYARGEARDYSDIDLLVISPDFEGGTLKDYKILDRAARRVTPLIEAIAYTPADFENFEKGDFIHEIRTSGKIVYKRAA
ncbi:MAG: nucleotidyltransferase domain-containing protein [Pseudomonadota bacterium]